MGLFLHTLRSQTFSFTMTPQVSWRPRSLQLIHFLSCIMIFNLLISALILGVVESQKANTSGELSNQTFITSTADYSVVESEKANASEGEPGNQTFITSTADYSVVESEKANASEGEPGNQTFITSTADYSILRKDNVTYSLYKDEQHQIEEGLKSNRTSFITEDDEDFQDQEIEFPGRHCHQDLLTIFCQIYCGEPFHSEMETISPENWCVLDNIIRPYNNLTLCLERISNIVGCYYPNPDIQDFFIEIHSFYFHNCSNEELLLMDAPQGLVITLTLIPVSLIPILVYLVIWKSKVQE